MKIDLSKIGKSIGNHYKTPNGTANWGKIGGDAAKTAAVITVTTVATDTAIETGREYRAKKIDYNFAIENYKNKIKKANEQLAKDTISEKKKEKLKKKIVEYNKQLQIYETAQKNA